MLYKSVYRRRHRTAMSGWQPIPHTSQIRITGGHISQQCKMTGHMTKKNISIGFRLRGNQTQKSFGSSTTLLSPNRAQSRYHSLELQSEFHRCHFKKRFRSYTAHITRWWTMEQSCESTESGTATSRITPASPETGRGGYITRSKLSSQVIMSIVMIMMMVMIMDSG